MSHKSQILAILLWGNCVSISVANDFFISPDEILTAQQHPVFLLQKQGEPGTDVLKPQRVETPPPTPVPGTEFELPEIDNTQPFTPPPDPFFPTPIQPVIPGIFWINHTDGDPYGTTPYTSFGTDQFPILTDSTSLLLQASGRVTNNGEGGATIGTHLRNVFDSPVGPMIAGAGLWYDVNQTPNDNVLHQGAVSAELLFDAVSFRFNGYHPLGPQQRTVERGAGTSVTTMFLDNRIVGVAGGSGVVETAMRGVDLDVGVNLGDTGLEGFLGYYHLKGDVGGSTDGIKGGLRGLLGNFLGGNVTVANDRMFGTSVFGGLTLYFDPFGNRTPNNFGTRLTAPVQRTPLVVVNEVGTSGGTSIVELTDGGDVITFVHIDSNAASGDGSFENPYANLTDANGVPADIVYVHADSVFNFQSIDLLPGQRLLGEGDSKTHVVQTDQFGQLTVPAGNGGTMRPIIRNPSAPIFLASDTEISNINIAFSGTGNPPDAAIQGVSLSGTVNINCVDIFGGMSGISVESSPNVLLNINDVNIARTTRRGIDAIDVGNLNINQTMINIFEDEAIGIFHSSFGGSSTINNTTVNMNNADPTVGIRIRSGDSLLPITLSGTNNVSVNANELTETFNNGGGFIGVIEVNMGNDNIPPTP